jgi:fluoride exporter
VTTKRFPLGVMAAAAIGGVAGTLLRVWVARVLPPGATGFPWGTLVVNLAGSFLLGFIVVTLIERAAPSRYVRPLLGTGFCGGLTTFSTFVVQVDLLVRAGHAGTALLYLAVSIVAGLAVVRLGMLIARAAGRREV